MSNNKKFLQKKKAILALISSSLILSQNVNASDEVKEDWKGRIFGALDKLAEISDNIEEPVIDAAKNISLYKQSSLRLVTSVPESNPEDERCYFFIDKNVPSYTKNYYLDINGNKVSKKSGEAVYQVDQTNYVPLGNDEADTYITKTYINLQTREITKNYVEFDSTYMFDQDLDRTIEFGIFNNVEDIIPTYLQHEKYTTAQLEMICDTLNDFNYEITNDTLSR